MIEPLETADYDVFFAYLDKQLGDNGKDGAPLFQPQPRSLSGFPESQRAGFVEGLAVAPGAPKWRRAWVYRDDEGAIVGHIDLRARREPFTAHRALLGMGLAKQCRRRGFGSTLVAHAVQWALDSGFIDFIDIEVLANNEPALALYRKSGFVFVARVDDMFRIDGQPEACITMTKRITR